MKFELPILTSAWWVFNNLIFLSIFKIFCDFDQLDEISLISSKLLIRFLKWDLNGYCFIFNIELKFALLSSWNNKEDKKEDKKENSKNKKNDEKGNKDEQEKEKNEPQEDKNEQKNSENSDNESLEEKLKKINMSKKKAEMILNALNNNEFQYIQQLKRKPNKKKDSTKPDW